MLTGEHSLRNLAWAGTLPFIVCAVLSILGIDSLPFIGTINHILILYALAIISFMAGVHWGQYLQDRERLPAGLLAESNVVAILAWICSFVFGAPIFLWLALVAFVVLLWTDFLLFRLGHIARGYFGLRVGVTVVVCVCLALAAVTGGNS